MEVKIVVDGTEVTLGTQALKDISSSLPDFSYLKEIFDQLALSEIAEVRANIAYKENISEDTVKLLLKDKDNSVLDNLICTDFAKQVITDEDLERILNHASDDIIKSIISYMDSFENIEDKNKFYSDILSMKNTDLQLSLAENYDTPKKILKQLLKSNDPDIANAAKASLE